MPDAPATPKPWTILLALQTRLAGISVANGYRTDIGANVELENTQDPTSTAEGITLYSMGLVKANDPRNQNTSIKYRDFTLVIEAATPITIAASVLPAHQRMHEIVEDIEQAFDTPLYFPGSAKALPAEFSDAVFLERPQGLPIVLAQYLMTTRYRR